MNIKKSIAFLLLLVSQCSFADQILFYFETSSGKEVKGVAEEYSYSDVRYTLFASGSDNPNTLVYEFAQAVMDRRTYYYDTANCPTGDCHAGFSAKSDAQMGILAGGGTRRNFNQNDAPNRTLENIATEIGSRVAGNIIDKWFENTDKNNSKLNIFVHSVDGVPTSMCVVTSGGCEALGPEHIIFASLDNGWTATYNDDRLGSPDYDLNNSIEQALERFIRHSQRNQRLTCRTVYTGSGDDLKPQVICYFSYY